MEKHFTSTVTIARSTVTGNKTTYATAATGVPCHIQPATGELALGQYGRFGKDYLIFSRVELRIGDRLTDGSGKEYEVDSVQRMDFRGQVHFESRATASS